MLAEDEFNKAIVFTGEMYRLAMDEAIRRQCKVGLLFIDWEAQFTLTIDFVRDCFRRYADYIERAEELIAVFAMAGSIAWASLAVAVRKGLVVW